MCTGRRVVELVEAVWRQATFEIGFCPLIHKDLNLCVAFAHSPLTLSHSPSDAACCVCVPLCVCQCVRNRQDTTVLRRLSGLCWVVLCCVCWVVFGVLAILDWRLGVRRDSGLWTVCTVRRLSSARVWVCASAALVLVSAAVSVSWPWHRLACCVCVCVCEVWLVAIVHI
jgi:hypothetical protein